MNDLTKEFIAESQEGMEQMELALTQLEKRPGDSELVSEIFRVVHTIKGATGFLGFIRLQALSHAGEDLLASLRDGRITVSSQLIDALLDLLDGLRRILLFIESTGTEPAESASDDDELIMLMSELKSGKITSAARRTLKPSALHASTSSTLDGTLRIDVEVLNRMMNLVGELVLTRNQIAQSKPGEEGFSELAHRLNNVTTELRDSVMLARMQPVAHLFQKFPRMVRDLSKACGRQARIEFEGQETALDKNLLEAIRDPLTHAVRNAIDHGIESPGLRINAGKPTEGLVRLCAFQQNGSIIIEVTDDGAGISTESVLAKAIEREIVMPEQASAMSEHAALQLIFIAGFSTAKQVTSISGRGVGMDVVRANVEKIGGSVEVESCFGIGTTVRLRIPLTLAIIPALIVSSGGQNFALPQSSLEELVFVKRCDAPSLIEQIGTAQLYPLRGQRIPLVWLDQALGLKRSVTDELRGIYIAALESDGRRFGLVVDNIKAPEEIVVKPLSVVLRQIDAFSGATVLGNGTLAMILDVTAIGTRAGVHPTARMDSTARPNRSAGGRMRDGIEDAADMACMCSLHAGDGLFGIDIKDIREVLGVTVPQHVPLAPPYIAGVVPYHGEVLTTASLRVLLGLEAATTAGNVIVLEDAEYGEQFGLMVDSLNGVVTVPQSALETIPASLTPQSAVLFDRAYKIPQGLIVRLNLQQLRPSRLASSGLPGTAKLIGNGEPK